MANAGYIKLYRSLLGWEWYSNINTCRLFLHLLLTANYEDKTWRGMTIKRGQRYCSAQSLAAETGLSRQNVRTAISNLVATNEITNQSTNSGMVITVVKYEDYQAVQPTNQPTNQPTPNQRTNHHSNQLTNQQPTNGDIGVELGKEGEKNFCQPATNQPANQQTNQRTNHYIRNKEYNNNIPPLPPTGGNEAEGEVVETKKRVREKYYLSLGTAHQLINQKTSAEEMRSALKEWATMRYAKRGEHRLTERAIDDGIARIRRYGYNDLETAVACVEQSILRNWDSFFPLDERGRG